MIFETWRNNLALHIYISFLKTTDIRPQFKDGRRNEKYGDESTLSERVFDVSKGSNLNPKEATSPRSVSTRTRHDTRAIFFSCAPIRREIESVFRSFANILLFDWTWTRKLMRLWKWAQKFKTFRWQFSEFTTETTEKFNKKNHFDDSWKQNRYFALLQISFSSITILFEPGNWFMRENGSEIENDRWQFSEFPSWKGTMRNLIRRIIWRIFKGL